MAIIQPPLAVTLVDEFSALSRHEDINVLFAQSGAVGGPPEGSRKAKLRQWLATTIRELDDEAQISFLGMLLHEFMEGLRSNDVGEPYEFYVESRRDRRASRARRQS